jgi:hypothetical protein
MYDPDRKGLIKIISTRYFLVIKEIKKISSRYDFDQYFRSACQLFYFRPTGLGGVRDISASLAPRTATKR